MTIIRRKTSNWKVEGVVVRFYSLFLLILNPTPEKYLRLHYRLWYKWVFHIDDFLIFLPSPNAGKDGEITTTHMLLGIWSEKESAGHKILATLGFNDEKASELAKSISIHTPWAFFLMFNQIKIPYLPLTQCSAIF